MPLYLLWIPGKRDWLVFGRCKRLIRGTDEAGGTGTIVGNDDGSSAAGKHEERVHFTG